MAAQLELQRGEAQKPSEVDTCAISKDENSDVE